MRIIEKLPHIIQTLSAMIHHYPPRSITLVLEAPPCQMKAGVKEVESAKAKDGRLLFLSKGAFGKD